MKYKIRVTIPKHQYDERTDERVKHSACQDIAKCLEPQLKLHSRDESPSNHHRDNYLMGPPSIIYEGSLYAYETARMEDIIAKLETAGHFTVNPQTRNIIQEVINELQENKPIG